MPFRDIDALLGCDSSIEPQPPRHPIVIIDDDESIRDALWILLSERYEITLCGSAQAGVDAVTEETCAVILDVKMGQRDGFWACDEIRKVVPNVPVIFYSAYQNLKDPFAIINDHHPFGYVSKGESIQKLLDMLGAAVNQQAIVVSNRKLIEGLKRSRQQAP